MSRETGPGPNVGGGESARALRGLSGGQQEAHAGQGEAVERPNKIERSDLKPRAISPGETEVVLQRHGEYVRDREDPQVGSLTDPGVEREEAVQYFSSFLAQVPEAQRQNVDVLFIASDTQYHEGGKRSYETATLAQEAAQEVFRTNGLPAANILNSTGRFHESREKGGRMPDEMGPKPVPNLREPNFLDESPDFLDFMLQQYGGVNLQFWTAFEEDRHKNVREAMGAEGPDDIADRTAFEIRVLATFARLYHQDNPDRRLIIWAGTHYDTISPFVKRDVYGVGKEEQLLVDYGAGITIDIDAKGHATTELGNEVYRVPLTGRKAEKRLDEQPPPEQSQT